MGIEDHYKTPFKLWVMSEAKVDGRLQKTWAEDIEDYLCGIFTPGTTKTVRVGKEDAIILKNLYCSILVPLKQFDYVVVDGSEYEIGNIKNTNNLGHHYQVNLISRIT